MYNFNKINELLEEKKVNRKQLFEAIGMYPTNGLSILNRDIRVSTLEKMADFFNVPTDYFFDRKCAVDKLSVKGSRNHLTNININSVIEANHYKELIVEKDRRIQLLEEMVELLKARVEIVDKSGTIS